jgi:voltage-gated potassium channel Kch
MSPKPTLRERLNYIFDNFMSKGTLALIGGLAVLSLIVILLAAAVLTIGGVVLAPEGSTAGLSFPEAVWESLMRTLDAGTMGGDVGWGYRLVMFLLPTLGGVFVISTLIGVLTTGVEGKLEELRKGRSRVLENDHTVILGWSPQIFTIISELVIANENRKRGAVIVILAEQDKVEMEDAIHERIENARNTRIICRSGSPMDLTELEIASPHTARSIIVLPPENNDPDSYVIKAVLALTNNPNRRAGRYHIVTEIRDQKNMEVIRLVSERDNVCAVMMGDLIARVTAQTSRQSGLSVVYTELLNFGGDEIYFQEEPALVGKPYGEALLAYEDSAVLGLRRADGTVNMNPAMDSRIEAGDMLFALSADDDTVHLSGLTSIPMAEEAIQKKGAAPKARIEMALVLGWNRCAATIIRELDHYVPKGSHLTVVADVEIEKEFKACCKGLVNQKASFRKDDASSRQVLDELDVSSYDHVIVLSYGDKDVQEADALTLVTLLHLRDIAERQGLHFSIVSEMLDLRNRELAEVAHVDDFIVSDHLVSLMLSQLSENNELYDVFTDVFDPEGSEIYLKPVSDYIKTEQPVNFYTLVEAARRRGETAIGYRLLREAGQPPSYGVHTNPKKSEFVAFAEDDKVVVLAEN